LSSKRLEQAFSASPQDPFASSNIASSLPVICAKKEKTIPSHVKIKTKIFLVLPTGTQTTAEKLNCRENT